MKRFFLIFMTNISILLLFVSCAGGLNDSNESSYEKLTKVLGITSSSNPKTEKKDDTEENEELDELSGKSIPDDKYTLCYGRDYIIYYDTGFASFIFPASAKKEYIVYWNDKNDGSAEFNSANNGADINVKAEAWSDLHTSEEIFDYIDNGYSTGKTFSVLSDCDVILYTEVISEGFFGIVVVEKETKSIVTLKRIWDINVVSDAIAYYGNDDYSLASKNWYTGTLKSGTDLFYFLSIEQSTRLYRICYECSDGELDFEVVQPDSAKQLILYRRKGICVFVPKFNDGSHIAGSVILRISLKNATSADYKIAVLDKGVYSSVDGFLTKPVTLTKLTQSRTVTLFAASNFEKLDFSADDSVTIDLRTITSSQLNTLVQKMQESNAEFILNLVNYGSYASFGEAWSDSCFAKTNLVSVITIPRKDNRNYFRNCKTIKNVTILKTTDVSDSLIVGDFAGCTSLEKVTLSNSVTAISDSTFADCTKLKSINFPNSLKGIDSYAFYNCESLESIKIPASVTFIGAHAFDGCTGLKSITFEKTSGWYRYSFELNNTDETLTDLSNSAKNVQWFTSSLWTPYIWNKKS